MKYYFVYRSCHPEATGPTVCQMLSELTFNELLDVIGSPKFNLSVLDDCFKYGCHLSLQVRVNMNHVNHVVMFCFLCRSVEGWSKEASYPLCLRRLKLVSCIGYYG